MGILLVIVAQFKISALRDILSLTLAALVINIAYDEAVILDQFESTNFGHALILALTGITVLMSNQIQMILESLYILQIGAVLIGVSRLYSGVQTDSYPGLQNDPDTIVAFVAAMTALVLPLYTKSLRVVTLYKHTYILSPRERLLVETGAILIVSVVVYLLYNHWTQKDISYHEQ